MLFHGLNKLTDSDGENAETDTSLDFAKDCGYITLQQHAEMTGLCREVGQMLGSMMTTPEKFCLRD